VKIVESHAGLKAKQRDQFLQTRVQGHLKRGMCDSPNRLLKYFPITSATQAARPL
jgi:hypothetical protein